MTIYCDQLHGIYYTIFLRCFSLNCVFIMQSI